MSIRIFYDNVTFRLEGWRETRRIVEKIIRSGDKVPGDLNFIITDDEDLRKINTRYLNHDYFTDVIAFNYTEGNVVNGEVYISIETVKINSRNYKVSLKTELIRVMIHGVLHLIGYEDGNEEEKMIIRKIEDKWLGEFERRENEL